MKVGRETAHKMGQKGWDNDKTCLLGRVHAPPNIEGAV